MAFRGLKKILESYFEYEYSLHVPPCVLDMLDTVLAAIYSLLRSAGN